MFAGEPVQISRDGSRYPLKMLVYILQTPIYTAILILPSLARDLAISHDRIQIISKFDSATEFRIFSPLAGDQ